nr:MAG TPA: hypothetical protein [Bacteriophage sp.]
MILFSYTFILYYITRQKLLCLFVLCVIIQAVR